MNKNVFLKKAETLTMEKLMNLASQMMRAEELVRDFQNSYTSLKQSGPLLQGYLQQKAELARLGREVDETIRTHEVQCHYCGEIHELGSVALVRTVPMIALRCPYPQSVDYLHLNTAEMRSLERILRYVQGETKNIFDTKLP